MAGVGGRKGNVESDVTIISTIIKIHFGLRNHKKEYN